MTISQLAGGKYLVRVIHNGVIGNAIKATPEAAFMNACIVRKETDVQFHATSFAIKQVFEVMT
jgi:hypothetical protein